MTDRRVAGVVNGLAEILRFAQNDTRSGGVHGCVFMCAGSFWRLTAIKAEFGLRLHSLGLVDAGPVVGYHDGVAGIYRVVFHAGGLAGYEAIQAAALSESDVMSCAVS